MWIPGFKEAERRELPALGLYGWARLDGPAGVPRRIRRQIERAPQDPGGGRVYIGIRPKVFQTFWSGDRIGQLVKYYRPDLTWNTASSEAYIYQS